MHAPRNEMLGFLFFLPSIKQEDLRRSTLKTLINKLLLSMVKSEPVVSVEAQDDVDAAFEAIWGEEGESDRICDVYTMYVIRSIELVVLTDDFFACNRRI